MKNVRRAGAVIAAAVFSVTALGGSAHAADTSWGRVAPDDASYADTSWGRSASSDYYLDTSWGR